MGIPARIARTPTGYSVLVAEPDAAHADATLDAYDAENAGARSVPDAAERDAYGGPGSTNAALAVTLAMLVFYGITGPRDPTVGWFEHGSADAAQILAGEVWRCVTALTLHADFAHVLGNALFGTFFLAALGRGVGPGLAFALAVGAGAGGNLANALLRSTAHVSVGASTAVFGAVGVLSGLAVMGRWRRRESWRRIPAPLAGALGLLAMLGTAGARVDLWAHLLGLAVGTLIGMAAAGLRDRPPGTLGQCAFGAAAIGSIAFCWRAALS